jgi:hypothetical protein
MMFSEISSFLVAHTSHGIWDWAGFVGSCLLGITAVFGGFVALKSFLASTQATSHDHMHQMFQRFLEARDRLSERLVKDADGDDSQSRRKKVSSLREDLDFGGSALYFLEEVFAWTVSEETQVKRVLMWPITSRQERRRRMDIVKSWRATIIAQLLTHKSDVLDSLKGYASCYGADFLSFAALTLRDDELIEIASRSVVAARSGGERPLGIHEGRQQKKLLHRADLLEGFGWRRPDDVLMASNRQAQGYANAERQTVDEATPKVG